MGGAHVHLDGLLWFLSVLLVGLRSGREGLVGSAKLAWRSRMIMPRRPEARSPGPRGPDAFSPTGGS